MPRLHLECRKMWYDGGISASPRPPTLTMQGAGAGAGVAWVVGLPLPQHFSATQTSRCNRSTTKRRPRPRARARSRVRLVLDVHATKKGRATKEGLNAAASNCGAHRSEVRDLRLEPEREQERERGREREWDNSTSAELTRDNSVQNGTNGVPVETNTDTGSELRTSENEEGGVKRIGDGEYLVILEDIHLSFGGKAVLNGLNLKLRRGEGTAIIGTSGTGKSTTLRVICGLELPDRGRVTVCGWERTKHIAEEVGPVKVAMVFQQGALFDSMTVGENVGFELHEVNRLPEARIKKLVGEALGSVGMRGTEDLYPRELSGGMRRRVAFARAVVHDPDIKDTIPEVVLYDEPSAGLDPTASTRIENCIRKLQEVCGTFVVVTHQLSTIRRTADRVVFLHKGAVQWDGSIHEVDHTDNPFVRQFMQASLDGPLTEN